VLTKSQLIAEFTAAIAFHSPNAMLETGLRMCLPEKSRTLAAFDA
jgi:hypothetical protein